MEATTFTKNSQRLPDLESGKGFLSLTVQVAEQRGLLCEHQFVFYDTVIMAYTSHGRFHPNDQDSHPGQGNFKFKGEKGGDKTHECKTATSANQSRTGPGAESILVHFASIGVHAASGLSPSARVGGIGEDSKFGHAF